MSVALSCPARRQSSHYLPAEAPLCWCEVRPFAAGSALLLQSLPCCHGLLPVVLFIWVWLELPWQWWPTSVMADSLCYGGLPQQWHSTSVGWSALVMADTPPPLSCAVLGSALLAVKLSTPSISSCCFVCFCGGGTR